MAVFLHLLLGVLRTLEGEVLQPGQHPAPRVHRAHQLVGGAETHGEGEVLGVVLGLDAVHIPCGALQPPNHLQAPGGAELCVWNGFIRFTFFEYKVRNN